MKRLRLSICAITALVVCLGTYLVLANDQHAHKKAASPASAETGPLANATVSFGAWRSSPPVNRFPNISITSTQNIHVIIPEVAKIKAGGTVNFIIAGFHQVIVYDDGTQPSDIDSSLTAPEATPPRPALLIDDPDGRIYRGLDPSLQPADRVEVVHFAEPGTYLVICGVLPHFNSGMIGYVRVVP
jgi:plastocyanin